MDQETVAFCVQHESMQKTNNATLKFDSIQFVTHTSVNMLNGTFTVPKSGKKKFIFVKDLLVNFWWIHWHQDKMVQLVQPKYGFDLDPILSSQSWFQIIWACVVPFVLWYQKLSMPWFPCKCKVLIHCWVPLTCSCQFPKSSWKLSNLFPKLKLIFSHKRGINCKGNLSLDKFVKSLTKGMMNFLMFCLAAVGSLQSHKCCCYIKPVYQSVEKPVSVYFSFQASIPFQYSTQQDFVVPYLYVDPQCWDSTKMNKFSGHFQGTWQLMLRLIKIW